MCDNYESLSMYQDIQYHHGHQHVNMEVVVHSFTCRQVNAAEGAHMHALCHSTAHV